MPRFLSETPILLDHLNASIQVIGINTDAYYSGALHAYRPIAAELRKLVCDYQRGQDISLLPRCFPSIHLHGVAGSSEETDENTTLRIPFRMSFDGKGGSEITELFRQTGPAFPIEEWRDQTLFSSKVTIKEFIKSVADKEGAHADETQNDALQLTKSVSFPGNESLAAKAIVAIARYIVEGIAVRSFLATGQARQVFDSIRREPSRGAVVMSLKQVCRNGIHRMDVPFVPQFDAPQLVVNPQELDQFMELINTYDPRTAFLLMTRDLNGCASNVLMISGARLPAVA